MISDTLKKHVSVPARPTEAENHTEVNIPITEENRVKSIATEVRDGAHLHKAHQLSIEPSTTSIHPDESYTSSESSNLIQFSTEGDTKQDDRPEVTHFESPFGHNEATPEQPFQLESIAVEIVGKATELKTETEATLGDEPEHINLPLNEPISPESRNLIIEAIEQQFTEIMNNPDNWSLENLQSSDEILHPGLVLSPEIKAYDATEFTDLLDEVFNQEDTSEESNASIPNTYVVPIVSREETGAFFTHLDIFIQERDIENAEEITDIFQETVTKIQDMLESATIDADALTVEIPALELESLLAACSEIVEYLGYASTEQNARRLLNRLIASVHTVQQLDLRNANNKVWLNTMGTYEHKFDNALSQLPGSMVVRELLHKAIGQYVLAKAQTMQ